MGVDKINAKDLLMWHQPSLASFFNIILVVEGLPSTARVTLIPKTDLPETPSDFRPIAITSVLTRALHKILARRLRETLVFSPLQHAFLKRDGCLEATALLHTLLRKTHDELRPLALVFLDLSKAFDTISHAAILGAAKRAGIPSPLRNYLEKLYETAEVRLGERRINCKRGVRQGVPHSPLLFILAMESVIEAAIPAIGVQLGDQCVHSIAYADELILLAEDQAGLQRKLTGLCEALRGVGMSLNERKSSSATIVRDGRRKALVLLPVNYLSSNGPITSMGVSDTQKYLGLQFGWKGKVVPSHSRRVVSMLRELKKPR